ncbi:MAG: methyltransferase domain-containing protein [Patescibacteria group bacterium]
MTIWETFFFEKSELLLEKGNVVLDVGGGLRVSKKKGNRFDKNRERLLPFLEQTDYKVLDPVPDYEPDIVGDIHHLPLPSNSLDAVFCLAVLEHVEDPWKAMDEMLRVLKPGGKILLYIPFLYYYHAERGYYKDYWRFSLDACKLLMKPFIHTEFVSVRGALETVLNLIPGGKTKILVSCARILDRVFKKTESLQTSGYYMYGEKKQSL